MIAIRTEFGGNFFFGLESAIAANVVHVNSVVEEHAAHEQSSVTGRRIFFRAKSSHSKFANSFFKAFYSLLKNACGSHAVIQNMPFLIVKFIPFEAATEFPPQVKMTNASRLKPQFQRILIEMSCVLRVGL